MQDNKPEDYGQGIFMEETASGDFIFNSAPTGVHAEESPKLHRQSGSPSTR